MLHRRRNPVTRQKKWGHQVPGDLEETAEGIIDSLVLAEA